MLKDSSKAAVLASPNNAAHAPAKPPWGIQAAGIVAFLSFLVLPIIAQIVLYMVPQLFGLSGDEANDWLTKAPLAMFLYILLADIMTLGLLFTFIRRKKRRISDTIGLRRLAWRDLGYTAVGTVVYFILFVVLFTIISQFLAVDTDKEQALGFAKDIGGTGLMLAFVSLVVLPPITEEIVFRGFLYGTLRANRLSVATSIIFTSLLFGSLHLFGGTGSELLWIAMIDTFALSIVLCYVREKTGSLVASIAIHALKNAFVFINLFIISGR